MPALHMHTHDSYCTHTDTHTHTHHTLVPEVGHVPLHVAPLDPARLGGDCVDHGEAVHPLGVAEGVPQQHVGAKADAEAHVPGGGGWGEARVEKITANAQSSLRLFDQSWALAVLFNLFTNEK